MKVPFTKMHGAGNDFIVIDSRSLNISDWSAFAVKYCNRWYGVGADQMLVLGASTIADFRMDIYNSDGSRVEMCGNGIRCFAKYVWDRKLSEKDILEVETLAGVIRPERAGENVKVDMGEPIFDPKLIPSTVQADPPVIDYPIEVGGKKFYMTLVSMGNPHAVIFLDEDVSRFPVKTIGPVIENSLLFPKRTNVEFVNLVNRGELIMRVWERGAGETLACGTGASATGVAAMLKGLTERKVKVRLKGGDLFIEWAANNRVYMTGPAEEVFEGVINYGY